MGVEVWRDAPTNIMLRGSESWVGWGCSLVTGDVEMRGGVREQESDYPGCPAAPACTNYLWRWWQVLHWLRLLRGFLGLAPPTAPLGPLTALGCLWGWAVCSEKHLEGQW